ncbi:zinc finger MYM-type protein 6-like, partial [Ruditapes philippinarum]|uniref:zinc finger MYM-type protein 6-like n=1 Tax=Ruditapes philippinarum TaxID=129788 RepID=UPI00295B7D6A
MFCLLCKTHNTSNKFNKQNTFNITPSNNFKHSAILDHQRSTGHNSTYLCELERRNSCLVSMHREAKESKDLVTFNAFLASYWLGKEEVSNKKLLSLIELQKQIGVEAMNHFKNTSERSQKDMRLLVGQMIKTKLVENVKTAKWFSLLVDEVTDCSSMEQLLIYVGYVDAQGDSHFQFLDCKDVLENSHSANAATITEVIVQELSSCHLSTDNLCGFGSDGASVMTGPKNGVGSRLQALAPNMLRSHCISHRLALA